MDNEVLSCAEVKPCFFLIAFHCIYTSKAKKIHILRACHGGCVVP